MTWVETLLRKRTAQVSTVAVVDSDDPKRLKQLISALSGNNAMKKTYSVYLWNVRGLFRVTWVEDEDEERELYDEIKSNFGGPMQLNDALRYIDGLFRKNRNVAFIVIPATRSEILSAFLKLWALDYSIYRNKALAVVFGGRHLVDDDVLRVAIVVDVPLSTREERRALVESLAAPSDEKVIDVGAGMTLHEFESACLESIALYNAIVADHVTAAKAEIVKKTKILEMEQPEYGFERIGGYAALKEFVRLNVVEVLKRPDKAAKLGLRPPRGLLFFGPPGTGKTLFAKALAKELGLPFLRLRTENVVSRWYGESERNMARILKIAEEVAPCVLFIDEIDRFGQRGQMGEHETTRRTFSILLEWLGDEKRKTIVIGTTNRIQDLDEAFIRVGRFDYLIPVLYPDEEARHQILEVHTSVARKVPLGDVDLVELAMRTEYFTGAELEELVIRAARCAFRRDADRVDWQDFEEAIATFRIEPRLRQRQMEEYMALAERYCNDASLLRFFR